MNNNVIYPSEYPPGYPPGYSQLPQTAGLSPNAPYAQSTLFQQPQPVPLPQPAWNDPKLNPYPPTAPPAPYGQPMASAYPSPGYGTPYHGGAPQPPPPPPPPQEQQQQQQVVVINNGQSQPTMYERAQSFIGHMVLACFVMWCCNGLFGLIAFILAGTCL